MSDSFPLKTATSSANNEREWHALSAAALLDTLCQAASAITPEPSRWLVIDAERASFVELKKEMRRRGSLCELYRASSIEDAKAFLAHMRVDLVVLREAPDDAAGKRLITIAGETPVVFLGRAALRRETASQAQSESRTLPGVCLVSAEGRWLAVSPDFCERVGRSAEELIGTDFQAIAHPADVDLEQGLLCRLVEGQIPRYELEKRFLRKDGVVVWLIVDVYLPRDQNGKAGNFVVSMRERVAATEGN